MSERKNLKPPIRQEDLVVALAAARTAWILTNLDRNHDRSRPLRRSAPAALKWKLPPRSLLNAGRCSAAAGKPSRCNN